MKANRLRKPRDLEHYTSAEKAIEGLRSAANKLEASAAPIALIKLRLRVWVYTPDDGRP